MDDIEADPAAGPGEGEGEVPVLALDGFHGPLDRLLTLARAHQIDLARLPLGTLVDQWRRHCGARRRRRRWGGKATGW
jgi:hypothetical protein